MSLVDADAFISTASSSGSVIVHLRKLTGTAHLLTTGIAINANGTTSFVVTAPTIDTTNDDVVTGDVIAIDVNAAGTGVKGLGVITNWRLP